MRVTVLKQHGPRSPFVACEPYKGFQNATTTQRLSAVSSRLKTRSGGTSCLQIFLYYACISRSNTSTGIIAQFGGLRFSVPYAHLVLVQAKVNPIAPEVCSGETVCTAASGPAAAQQEKFDDTTRLCFCASSPPDQKRQVRRRMARLAPPPPSIRTVTLNSHIIVMMSESDFSCSVLERITPKCISSGSHRTASPLLWPPCPTKSGKQKA